MKGNPNYLTIKGNRTSFNIQTDQLEQGSSTVECLSANDQSILADILHARDKDSTTDVPAQTNVVRPKPNKNVIQSSLKRSTFIYTRRTFVQC